MLASLRTIFEDEMTWVKVSVCFLRKSVKEGIYEPFLRFLIFSAVSFRLTFFLKLRSETEAECLLNANDFFSFGGLYPLLKLFLKFLKLSYEMAFERVDANCLSPLDLSVAKTVPLLELRSLFPKVCPGWYFMFDRRGGYAIPPWIFMTLFDVFSWAV